MSQFIDYTKRSVTLPAGCRDLMDVLRRDEVCSGDHPASRRKESATGRLSDVGEYVGKLFESKADLIFLFIEIPAEQICIEMHRAAGAMKTFSVKFIHGFDQETAMTAFLERHGFQRPKETGAPFSVQSMYAVSPLPTDPAAISSLATELFRDVCRLGDKAEIAFWYWERTRGN